MKLLVTGGAGFVGGSLVRLVLEETGHSVVNVDCLTYAAAPEALAGLDDGRLTHEQVDVCDAARLREIFARHRPDAVVHLAAESHVDRSITAPARFVQTNVLGTHALLEVVRDYWHELPRDRAREFRLVHVSTDEVFGSRAGDEHVDVDACHAPSSPYAASKAAADQLAWSYRRTWGIPLIVTHSCNNYGPWQHPEKLVPVVITRALEGRAIPVYGSGEHIRDWLYVDDHARALLRLLQAASPGTAWGISAGCERTNVELVEAICNAVDALVGRRGSSPSRALMRHVADRPGHDHRYGLVATRIRDQLGWRPRTDLADGIARTAAWYHDHREWYRRRLDAGIRRAAAP